MLGRFYVQISIIFLVLLLGLAALQVAVALRAFETRQVEVDQRVNRGLASDMAGEISPHLREGSEPQQVGSIIHYMMVLNPSVEIYVLNEKGRILAFFAEPGRTVQLDRIDLAPVHRFIAGEELPILGDDPRRPETSRHFSAAPLALSNTENGYLYIVLHSTNYDAARSDLESIYLREAILDSFLVALPLIAALGLLVFFALTRRLERLSRTVTAFGNGTYTLRAPVAHRDEIGRLGESFNYMADTIERNFEELARSDRERRELVASISHDLRNPLSSIRGYTETLLEKETELSLEDRRRYLRVSLDRIAALSRLIDDLFQLAKLESPSAAPRRERFSLSELIQDVTMQMNPMAGDAGIRLEAEEPSDMFEVEADIGLIERALSNLTENAIRYTPQGGHVTVAAVPATMRGETAVRVRISDTGHGIQPGDETRIFERFQIADSSRATAKQGSGLGLAIAKRIVELHEGEIGIESTGESGTVFYFELPLPRVVSESP